MYSTNSRGSNVTSTGNTLSNCNTTNNYYAPSTSVSVARGNSKEFKVNVKLPFRKNENFCGREATFEQLHQTLHPPNASGSVTGRKTAILYGLGGVGKTQIELEYAHRHQFSHVYTSIFWIDADNSSRTNESALEVIEQLVAHYAKKWSSSPDFAEIANTLGIPGKIDDSGRMIQGATEIALETVHNWLGREGNRGWLLLIDNKDKVEASDLDKLLPTCRGQGNRRSAGRTPACIRPSRCVHLCEITFKNSLSEPSLSSYKASVYTTWELSFRELCHDAQLLLQLCAFLSNEDIPQEIFRRGKKAVDWITEDEDRLEKAIEDLFTFSLAKRKGSRDSFWIHPLVHTWTRQRINPTERRQNTENAITLVTSTIVTDAHERSPADWIFTRRILSHLDVCEEHVSEYFSGSDATPGVSTNMAFVFDYQGRYNDALEMYQRALGSDHPETLTTVHNMAQVFDNQGRYSKALEMYQRALAGYEKALGSDYPYTLTTVDRMAAVFYKQGRHDDALEWFNFQRALTGREKTLGEDHPHTLSTAHSIADISAEMRERERKPRNLPLRQEASTIRRVSPEAMPLSFTQETEERESETRQDLSLRQEASTVRGVSPEAIPFTQETGERGKLKKRLKQKCKVQ